jgi:hypothetical protein
MENVYHNCKLDFPALSNPNVAAARLARFSAIDNLRLLNGGNQILLTIARSHIENGVRLQFKGSAPPAGNSPFHFGSSAPLPTSAEEVRAQWVELQHMENVFHKCKLDLPALSKSNASAPKPLCVLVIDNARLLNGVIQILLIDAHSHIEDGVRVQFKGSAPPAGDYKNTGMFMRNSQACKQWLEEYMVESLVLPSPPAGEFPFQPLVCIGQAGKKGIYVFPPVSRREFIRRLDISHFRDVYTCGLCFPVHPVPDVPLSIYFWQTD